jgi:predicted nucleotidyltransferase component of viral defense system
MLKPETLAVWHALKDEKALHGFILIGGTALAMHLNHRMSEDLDFAWPADKLPQDRIKAIRQILSENHIRMVENDSLAALQEFEDSGLDLHDYEQNFIANNAVKVTFFAPDHELRIQLRSADPNHVRVASVDEIFRLKCIACANRSKTRDWFDMFTLFERGLFQPIDMIEAFERSSTLMKLDLALSRMSTGQPDRDDEGYATLLESAPSVKTLQERFKKARDDIEIELARRQTH